MIKPRAFIAIIALLLIITLTGCGKQVSSIAIEKSTNGEDADSAPGPAILVGDPVTWTYTITNKGTVALERILVTDDDPSVSPTYKSGDSNSDGILQISETWVYEAEGLAVQGQYSNTGTVEAWAGASKKTASDLSHYNGQETPGTATWEFDFMQPGADALMADESWLITGVTGAATEGLWLNQCVLAPPVFFTGDFTAEYYFYPRVLTDDDLYRMSFRIWNNEYATNSLRRFVAFTMYYLASPVHTDAYYQVDQGNGSYANIDHDGDAPGMNRNAINVCVFEKTGSQVDIYLNSSFIKHVDILPDNAATGYAPMVHGQSSWDMADSNMFIRKIKVTYKSGEFFNDPW